MRDELELGREAVPDVTLKRIWLALDKDSSGWITAGEFGGFMRRGEKAMTLAQPSWKERAQQAREREATAVRAAKSVMNHTDIKNALAGEQPASSDEVIGY